MSILSTDAKCCTATGKIIFLHSKKKHEKFHTEKKIGPQKLIQKKISVITNVPKIFLYKKYEKFNYLQQPNLIINEKQRNPPFYMESHTCLLALPCDL